MSSSEMRFRLWQTGEFDTRELEIATPYELFEAWCNYEGIGHAQSILCALKECGYIVSVPNSGRGYVIQCIHLNEMPYDKEGVHATGNFVYFESGDYEYEYEDSAFEYADDCNHLFEDGTEVPEEILKMMED